MIGALCFSVVAFLAQPTAPEAAGLAQRLLGMPDKVPTAMAEDQRPADFALRGIGQTVWALTLAGQGAEAGKLAEFGLGCLELDARAERPQGSVAPVVDGKGRARLPRCYADAHAVAAILEGAWRHAASLPDTTRQAWLERWWNPIAGGAEFVVGWTRGARGEPFAAYDPGEDRDTGGPREALGALVGVACAQALAEAAGKPVPEAWTQRRQALEILVRTTDFSAGQRVPWGPQDLRGVVPDDHPLWNARLREGNAEWTLRQYAWREPSPNGPRWESQPEQVLIALLAPRPAEAAAFIDATVEQWRARRAGKAEAPE